VKEGDFNAPWRAETERFSGRQFRSAVESFDNSRRDGAFGPESVEDQVPMTPQALGPGLNIALELRFDQAVHEADVVVDETTMNNEQ
jgi:hypothetical protein